tara:strand:- start:1831 stop:2625 length:795 start_codon:yes stop_codon:yes gene_type:complete
MRTLYIFGDSFTVDYKTDWTWTRQLADKLRVDAMFNDSIIGCSNEWIMSKVKENQDKITKDDIVVIVLTSPYRYWFFKDKPELSNYRIGNWDNFAKKHEKGHVEAVRGYVNYLQRDELDSFRLEHQVSWIKELKRKIGFTLLLIPGFTVDIDYTDTIKVYGDMTGSVSNAEFVSQKDDEQWYTDGIDTRYNHMIKDNHEVMATKCVNSVLTGNTLDLTTGFSRHILKGNERLTHKQIGPKLVETSNKLYKDEPKNLSHWLGYPR